MKRELIVLLISLLPLSTPTAAPQEKPRAEYVFQCLPEGNYESINHTDYLRLSKSPVYRTLVDLVLPANGEKNRPNPLPPSLREDVESETMATLSSPEISETAVDNERSKQRRKTGSSTPSVKIGDKLYKISDSGKSLLVYCYTDLDTLIKSALKKTEIEKTEHSVDGRSIYRFIYRAADGSEAEYYAYATVLQELLVAGELGLLKNMIDAGLGFDLSIMDSENYSDLVKMVPNLGPIWFFENAIYKYKYLNERLTEEGVDGDELDNLKSQIESSLQYTVSTWLLSDEIVFRTTRKYPSDTVAERGMDILERPLRARARAKRNSFDLIKRQETEHEQDGDMVISDLVYDKDLLKACIRPAEAAVKQLEKRLAVLVQGVGNETDIAALEKRIKAIKESIERIKD